MGGGWYTKVNLKIDIFMNLTKHYCVFAVLGTFIGTENDAKNKPKNFHRFYILAEEAVNKERNSFMPSTDYCYEEKPSRVRRERARWGRRALKFINVIRRDFSNKWHLSRDMN